MQLKCWTAILCVLFKKKNESYSQVPLWQGQMIWQINVFTLTPSNCFMQHWIQFKVMSPIADVQNLIHKYFKYLYAQHNWKVLSEPMLAYVNWILRDSFQWNLNQHTTILFHENESDKVGWKMSAILSQPQSINQLNQWHPLPISWSVGAVTMASSCVL